MGLDASGISSISPEYESP
jgi:hypothetical protein